MTNDLLSLKNDADKLSRDIWKFRMNLYEFVRKKNDKEFGFTSKGYTSKFRITENGSLHYECGFTNNLHPRSVDSFEIGELLSKFRNTVKWASSKEI